MIRIFLINPHGHGSLSSLDISSLAHIMEIKDMPSSFYSVCLSYVQVIRIYKKKKRFHVIFKHHKKKFII
jgi:hypothetical protein